MRVDTRIPVSGIVGKSGAVAVPPSGAPPSGPADAPFTAERRAEADVDRFLRLAALTLGADVAAVSLAHSDQMVFESCIRLPDLRATRSRRPLSGSFAGLVLESEGPLVIEDARAFASDPGGPALVEGIRTYVGVPLRASGSDVPGTLSVSGYSPRSWAPSEIEVLRIIAGSIATEIDLKSEIQRMEREQNERLTAERRTALQQLTLGLRHELNNALAGLVLETELLGGAGLEPGRYRDSVASIQNQVWRIHDVLRRLDDVDALRTKPYLDRGLMIDLSEPTGDRAGGWPGG